MSSEVYDWAQDEQVNTIIVDLYARAQIISDLFRKQEQ